MWPSQKQHRKRGSLQHFNIPHCGPQPDGHTDGGRGTVILQGRDGQAIGQSGNLQGLGLDQLTLGLGNSLRLGSKCTLGSCLKSTNLVSLDLS